MAKSSFLLFLKLEKSKSKKFQVRVVLRKEAMKALSVVCLVLLTFALSEGRRIPKELSSPVKIPAGWKNLGPADPNARVKLTIAIKQRNTDLLEVN